MWYRLTSGDGAQTIGAMAERDAFGREIGEDPLADMGWKGPGAAPPDAPTETAATLGEFGRGASAPSVPRGERARSAGAGLGDSRSVGGGLGDSPRGGDGRTAPGGPQRPGTGPAGLPGAVPPGG